MTISINPQFVTLLPLTPGPNQETWSDPSPRTHLMPGQVLGKVTASGKYTVYSSAASDGSQVVAGVLKRPVERRNIDQDGILYGVGETLRMGDLIGADAATCAALSAIGHVFIGPIDDHQ